MRLLIMGGTSFLGRACAQEALRRGHQVTTFNRGRSGEDVPGVVPLQGDRTEPADLEILRGQEWDAVIDTCGFVPRVVRGSAQVLDGHVGRYAFVSSVSAGALWPEKQDDDRGAAFDCPPDAGPDDGDYGKLKAGCERAVQEQFDGRALVIRPGLILGPHESIGRLPWWLSRTSRGGRVVAPGDPAQPMQVVDAPDIAVFTVDALERGLAGVFNVTGPASNTSYGEWLRDCVELTGAAAELIWVNDDVLVEHEVEPWTELPLWLPAAEVAHAWNVSANRARAEGLRCRPVRETVEDTWAWLRHALASGHPGVWKGHGLAPDKEQRILAAWDARR